MYQHKDKNRPSDCPISQKDVMQQAETNSIKRKYKTEIRVLLTLTP